MVESAIPTWRITRWASCSTRNRMDRYRAARASRGHRSMERDTNCQQPHSQSLLEEGGTNARMSVHQTDQERLATCRSNVSLPGKAFAMIVVDRPFQDLIPLPNATASQSEATGGSLPTSQVGEDVPVAKGRVCCVLPQVPTLRLTCTYPSGQRKEVTTHCRTYAVRF